VFWKKFVKDAERGMLCQNVERAEFIREEPSGGRRVKRPAKKYSHEKEALL
jgi:hypothetical protein